MLGGCTLVYLRQRTGYLNSPLVVHVHRQVSSEKMWKSVQTKILSEVPVTEKRNAFLKTVSLLFRHTQTKVDNDTVITSG